ncbi:MAG: 2-phospho-L-lactate transferase [SAR202 cluster bacterium]|nr:2-phospho-L-lactate transferase [SAR202 cluster bacterium]MDP6714327.1 2-phospho-L-lactate transferase [SAR202 cluster bacterium]
MPSYDTNALALAGGVGGAKLALGLAKILTPEQLTVVVNTGDDEVFYGLHVSPDLDTVMYTLAGIANPESGWGITGETFNMLERLSAYGEDTWFGLGDKDLATHIRRTDLLRNGETLSEVTAKLATALGVNHGIVPMTDDSLKTVVDTEIGSLAFQDYFVKHRSEPKANAIRFETDGGASPSPGFDNALNDADIIVYCPSNPYLSVAPILEVAGVRERIKLFSGRRVAVSPIVGGEAIKGPAAKLMAEFGVEPSCVDVAKQYVGLCDLFVIDDVDAGRANDIEALGMDVLVCNTIMNSDEDKTELAGKVLDFALR